MSKTLTELEAELYTLVLERYSRNGDDAYARHLAAVAVDYYFKDLRNMTRGWSNEGVADHYDYEIGRFKTLKAQFEQAAA